MSTYPQSPPLYSASANPGFSAASAVRARDFAGLWIPLVTPFKDHAIDLQALAGLVAHYRGTGIAGFVACGSTGEASSLDEDEKLLVLQTTL